MHWLVYQEILFNDESNYHPCLFGYFRAIRFAGDLTDLGVEIQIQNYEIHYDNDESLFVYKNKQYLQKELIFDNPSR
jgi:hypothetical protein